ncbi:MAG: phosphopyruvate hydratase, partial [Actinomycetota bacterium]
MIGLDGTEDKSRLGANAIIATSLAVAQAAADETGMPLFRYIGGAGAHLLPVPLLNVLNGGAHCDNNVDVQEFMIVPHGAASFSEALQMGSEVYHALKNLLKTRGLSTSVGDEGGFGPDLKSNEQALELLVEAISSAGYEPGAEVALALDVAASQMLTGGSYFLAAEDKTLSAEEMGGLYESWIGRFPIVSIEDPLDEEDWEGWKALTTAIGGKVQLVGDDLFVTNVVRLERGIESETANSILVKVNQIGTVSETGETVSRAIAAGYTAVISHRSGETEDTAIADLAVAWGTGQIKTGAPARSERMAKYNQLLRIEEILAESARYSGSLAFPLAAGTPG